MREWPRPRTTDREAEMGQALPPAPDSCSAPASGGGLVGNRSTESLPAYRSRFTGLTTVAVGVLPGAVLRKGFASEGGTRRQPCAVM